MKPKDEKPKEEGARSFARTFEMVAEGDAHAEASWALHSLLGKLADAAELRGRAKGSLVLTLHFEHDKKGNTVSVDYELKSREPKPVRANSRFWLTDGGNLSPENPRQTKLPLREVPNPETRVADAEDAPAPARSV